MHQKSNARKVTHPSTLLALDGFTLKGRRVSIYCHITLHGFLRVKEKILYTHKFEASFKTLSCVHEKSKLYSNLTLMVKMQCMYLQARAPVLCV